MLQIYLTTGLFATCMSTLWCFFIVDPQVNIVLFGDVYEINPPMLKPSIIEVKYYQKMDEIFISRNKC